MDLQRMFDDGTPAGVQYYVKSDFLTGLNPDALGWLPPTGGHCPRRATRCCCAASAGASPTSNRPPPRSPPATHSTCCCSPRLDRPGRRPGAAPGLGARRRGRGTAVGARHLRQPSRRRGHRPPPGGLPAHHLAPTHRPQAANGPGQRIRPQPKHPTPGVAHAAASRALTADDLVRRRRRAGAALHRPAGA